MPQGRTHFLAINTAIADFNELSVYDVPKLNIDRLSQLQTGQLVTIIDGGNGDNQPKRGIAYKLLEPGMTEALVSLSR